MHRSLNFAEHPALFVSIIVGSLLLHLLYRAWRDRLRGAGLVFEQKPFGTLMTTKLGKFSFERSKQQIRMETKTGKHVLPYDDVIGLKYEHGLKNASWQEFLFEGFNIFDFHQRYRDRMHSYSVSIVTPRGEIPVFGVAQYEVRDMWDFATPLMHALLKLVGLYKDGKTYGKQISRQLEQFFQKEGFDISLSNY